MNRVFSSLITLILISTSTIYAQDFGFLGRKNVISMVGTISYRQFPATGYVFGGNGFIVNRYSEEDGMVKKSIPLSSSIRMGYRRQINKRLALGLEFSYEKTCLAIDRYDELIKSGMTPMFRSYQPMAVISFTNKGNIAPMGFSITVGIGPKFYHFVKHIDYWVYDKYAPGKYSVTSLMYPDYEHEIVGLNTFFELGHRIPITEYFAVEVGARFHTGFTVKGSNKMTSSENDESSYLFRKGEVNQYLNHENVANLVSIKFGLGFVF